MNTPAVQHKDAMLRLAKDIQRRMQNEDYGNLPLRGVQHVERDDLVQALRSIQSLSQNYGTRFDKGKEPKGKAKELFLAAGLPVS